MPKKVAYTQITVLPRNIPRQLALDMLHSHSEIIELNPLVTGHRAIPVPRDAAADEYFAQWHEIDEIITWGPGLKKKISFKGVYHDMPWGLQTHVYAPFNIDLRNKWQIRGNQPGEPREPRELGMETPTEGLYLREDVQIIANMTLTGFVKKEMKAAAATMVDRLKRKAELLDEGVLQAMFEGGRLKTVNPAQEAHLSNAQKALGGKGSLGGSSTGILSPISSPPGSPRNFDKSLEAGGGNYMGNYHDVARANSSRHSPYMPAYQQDGYQGPDMRRVSQVSTSNASQYGNSYQPPEGVVEAPGNYYHPQVTSQNQPFKPQDVGFTAELPGSEQFLTPQVTNQGSNPNGGKQSPYQGQALPNGQQIMQRHSSSYSQPRYSPIASHPTPEGSPQPPQLQHHDSQELPATNGLGISTQPPQQNGGYQPYIPQEHTAPTAGARDHRASSASQTSYQPYQQQPSPALSSDQRFSTAGLRESLPPVPNGAAPLQQQRFEPNRLSFAQGDDAVVPAALRPRSQILAEGARRQSDVPEAGVVRCPVCKNFSGDETAVSHHVSTHFT